MPPVTGTVCPEGFLRADATRECEGSPNQPLDPLDEAGVTRRAVMHGTRA